MRSPKESSRQFDRFRSYVSDHLTLCLTLLVLAVAGTPVAVLAGATAARERERVATSVDSKVFVEPANQPLVMFATFTVNTLGDAADTNTADNLCDSDAAPNEQCTLRAAIQQANATAGADTIHFDIAGAAPHTVQLASELPDLSSDIDIDGPGANLLTVARSAETRFRIFTVTSGVTVNISGLTVTNGHTADGMSGGHGVDGGGISNSGTLTLSGVTVSDNRTGKGLDLTGVFTGGGGAGAGIINIGTMNLVNSTVSGNQAGNGGNAAPSFPNGSGGEGGGIANVGTLTISNSTISGNRGGLAGTGGNAGTGISGKGGGIFNNVALTISNSTITANSAAVGGGIYRNSGSITLKSTIVAGNTASAAGPDIWGNVSSDGFNLIQSTTDTTINQNMGAGPNITGIDPQLGPLANNGGPTQTHHLLAGSPAIDKGDDFSASATTDQRGFLRPFDDPAILNAGDGTDIGAYEVQDRGVVQVAPSLVVNTPGDHDDGCTTGDCTLREAILAANAAAGADTITFDATIFAAPGPHVIQLTGALPDLSSDITMNGPGARVLSVRGEGASDRYRIFTIPSGVTVNILGLTVTNGHTADGMSGSGDNGGGILNSGTLTLTAVVVSGNRTGNGGDGGISVGAIGGFGGGILNLGTLTITNSTVSGNQTGSGGSGMPGGVGGPGGGIFNGGVSTITNSTVSGNQTGSGGGSSGGGIGGGILNTSTLSLTNSTVSGNQSGTGGGGIYHGNATPTTTVRGSIIAGNSAPIGPDYNGPANSEGYNLVGKTNNSTGFTQPTDQTGTSAAPLDPQLGPLANNGGPTETHAVLSTSPAIDKGNAFGLTTDQRGAGFPRVVGATADVGAVEGPDIVPPTVTINQASTQADPTNGSPVNFTVVFSESVADFATGDVTLSGTAGATTANVTGSGTTYNVAVSGMTANGTIVATIAASKATDAAGNPNAASTSLDNTVTFTAFPAVITATAGTPQSAAINTAFATALQATVTDGSGAPAAGVTVTFNAPPSGPSGTFANGTTTTNATTNASGVATATTFTANSIVGSYTVTASANGGTLSTSFSLTNTSPANVSGTKTVSGTFNEGNTVTYTITLSNSGPAAQLDNPGNEFTDVLPATLTLVSASATSGTATTAANTVNWNGSIPAGSSITITITATINDVLDGTIVSNQGTISYDADGNGTNEASRLTDDPAVGGTSDPTSFAAVSKSDLTIAKSHSGNFSGGQLGATYTITVSNIGTGVTSGLVTVTDNVPVGLTPTGPNGVVNGWTCSINGQTVTCTRSDVLADGASYPPINLTVNVANPAPLNVVNTATVAGGGEVNTGNNTASDPTAINCSADFSLNNTSPLMISRFRENGPAGPQDEFVEIYNPNPIPHTVASGNCNGGGYGVYASAGNGTTSNTATLVCYIPNGTVIPAGGYYLCTGVTYSLSNLGLNGGAAGATATGDAPIGCGGTCGADIPNDAGLVLTNKAEPTVTTPENFGVVEFGEVIYDKVGFGPYGPAAPAPGYPTFASIYCEGGAAGCLKPVGDASTGAPCTNPSGQFPVVSVPPACYGLAGQYEFLRRQTTFSATEGTTHQDTNNSGNDFILVAPNLATNMGQTITGVAGVTAVLGAARPYNRQAPPDMPAVKLPRTPFDGPDQLGPRNVERRFIPDPTIADLANNPLGTFTLRFKFTNNSGLPINGLRFEVDNLSTLCGPQVPAPTTASVGTGDARNVGATPGCGAGSFTAIFKALNSTSEIVVDGAGTAQFVNGTVMEDLSVGQSPTPPGAGPLSPKGGGIDSTYIINPSSNAASVGDGVTGGVGNFATVIGTTDPTKVIRVRVKFGVVRSGRFILLLVPMVRSSPAP